MLVANALFLLKNGSWGREGGRAGGYENTLEEGPASLQPSLGQSRETCCGRQDFRDSNGTCPLSSTYPSSHASLCSWLPSSFPYHWPGPVPTSYTGSALKQKSTLPAFTEGMVQYRLRPLRPQPQVILDLSLSLTPHKEFISKFCQI